MSCLPKPVLRGHISRNAMIAIFGGLTFAAINSSLFYFFYRAPQQKKYEDFIKSYDEDAHYENLLKWGYYTSVKKPEE